MSSLPPRSYGVNELTYKDEQKRRLKWLSQSDALEESLREKN